MAEARRVADRIARQPGPAVRGTKSVLNMHLAQALGGAVPAGFAAELVSMQSDEHRARLDALRARAPRS
jgi:enoyl-CoA hydratase